MSNIVKTEDLINSPPPEGWLDEVETGWLKINDSRIKCTTITRLPYNPKLTEKRQELRYAHNLPEVLFWNQVKNSKFHNIDFDRQKIIGNYIVDFYVKQLGLVIEIDGLYHNFKRRL